jgi:putative phosphoribosyl transferase
MQAADRHAGIARTLAYPAVSLIRRFPDLASAGIPLGEALAAYTGREEVVVLGLARGGVPAAVEVARRLGVRFDVALLRRLIPAAGPTPTQAVFNLAGTRVMDEGLTEGHSPPVQSYLVDAMADFARREQASRGGRPPLELEGATVVLVDNGVRTGGTIRISLRALRAAGCGRIVVAVPFAAAPTREPLQAEADEVVCLDWNDWSGTVAAAYRRFEVPDYDRIGEILNEFEG